MGDWTTQHCLRFIKYYWIVLILSGLLLFFLDYLLNPIGFAYSTPAFFSLFNFFSTMGLWLTISLLALALLLSYNEQDRRSITRFVAALFLIGALLGFWEINSLIGFVKSIGPSHQPWHIEAIESILSTSVKILFYFLLAGLFYWTPTKAYKAIIAYHITALVFIVIPLPWTWFGFEIDFSTATNPRDVVGEYFYRADIGVNDFCWLFALYLSLSMSHRYEMLKAFHLSVALLFIWLCLRNVAHKIFPLKYPAELQAYYEPDILGHAYAGGAYGHYLITAVLLLALPLLAAHLILKAPRKLWMATAAYTVVYFSWMFLAPEPNSALTLEIIGVDRTEYNEMQKDQITVVGSTYSSEYILNAFRFEGFIVGILVLLENLFAWLSYIVSAYLPYVLMLTYSAYLARREDPPLPEAQGA